jgi:hypothetical protein
MESEAGRATPTTAKKLISDLPDVKDVLEKNPDIRLSLRNKTAKEVRPEVEAKMASARAGQPERYLAVDEALAKDPLTITGLLKKILEKEKDIPDSRLPMVKSALKKVREDLRNDFAERWTGAPWSGGKHVVTMDELRKFATSVSATAEAAMGSINGTNAAKVPKDVSKLINDILEERLDLAVTKGGDPLKKVVSEIRDSDRQFSAWKRIDSALTDRAWKEEAQAVGLSGKLASGSQGQMDAAAAGLALAGQVPAAAGLVVQSRLRSALQSGGRTVNDTILAPMELAARNGASWAQVSQMALENGLPQSVARALFARAINKPYTPIAPQSEME